MKILQSTMLLKGLLICSLAAFWTSAGVPGRAAGVDVEFRPLREESVAGEPVILRMVITNTTAGRIAVDLGTDRVQALRFGTDIDKLATNRLVRRLRITRPPRLEIGPHGTYSQYVILDEWIKFDPGVHRVVGVTPVHDGGVAFGSFFVKILPFDREKLRHRVSELVESARTARSAELRNASLLALRALYRLSEEGKDLLTVDLKVDGDLLTRIAQDPYD